MKNPIMYRLGKKLLWGQYEGNVLVKTFIYDDEIDEERRIKPIDVPKRYYSEILYDVFKVTEGEEGKSI